jgi:hypothetical protein
MGDPGLRPGFLQLRVEALRALAGGVPEVPAGEVDGGERAR